eukprot:54284-Rhodomonas_salina.1
MALSVSSAHGRACERRERDRATGRQGQTQPERQRQTKTDRDRDRQTGRERGSTRPRAWRRPLRSGSSTCEPLTQYHASSHMPRPLPQYPTRPLSQYPTRPVS